MRYVMVDVEADGPIPGNYSMVYFGAIIIDSVKKEIRRERRQESPDWERFEFRKRVLAGVVWARGSGEARVVSDANF